MVWKEGQDSQLDPKWIFSRIYRKVLARGSPESINLSRVPCSGKNRSYHRTNISRDKICGLLPLRKYFAIAFSFKSGLTSQLVRSISGRIKVMLVMSKKKRKRIRCTPRLLLKELYWYPNPPRWPRNNSILWVCCMGFPWPYCGPSCGFDVLQLPNLEIFHILHLQLASFVLNFIVFPFLAS